MDQGKPLLHQDHIGIVADIAARGAEVDDARRFRALLSVGVNMAHHIVPYLSLTLFCHLVINIVLMALQLVDHFPGNHRLPVFRKAELHLRLGQGDPQPPPGLKLFILGKDVLHFLPRVTLRKRADILVRTHQISSPVSFL